MIALMKPGMTSTTSRIVRTTADSSLRSGRLPFDSLERFGLAGLEAAAVMPAAVVAEVGEAARGSRAPRPRSPRVRAAGRVPARRSRRAFDGEPDRRARRGSPCCRFTRELGEVLAGVLGVEVPLPAPGVLPALPPPELLPVDPPPLEPLPLELPVFGGLAVDPPPVRPLPRPFPSPLPRPLPLPRPFEFPLPRPLPLPPALPRPVGAGGLPPDTPCADGLPP
jgi:hypothetical protein